MAAPAPTARTLPTGFKLRNGYRTLITFEFDFNMNIFEIAVGLPGMDTGDPVDTTTQINEVYRTMSARTLVTLTPFQVTAAYSALVYTELFNQLGVEQVITITLPDTSTIAFFGYVQLVEFDQLVDGEMPQITITITPTNYDPDDCSEAGPVIDDNGTC